MRWRAGAIPRSLRRRFPRARHRLAAPSIRSGDNAENPYRHGKWSDAAKLLDRALLEFAPGDPRIARAHFYLGEARLRQGSQLEAAREFRKASDETPNDPIAPEALLRLGDVYADLWRRPELDPTYGQTALATYQELLNRYPGGSAAKRAQERINELNERFAYKEYKAAMYYFRLKAYDSAILYLKDLVATYPQGRGRTGCADQAGAGLQDAGIPRGRAGDLRVHPAISSQGARSWGEYVPPDSTGA